MSKSLVIVESPAKAKTISRYLGENYKVMSSVGHIRDLSSGKNSKTTATKKTAVKRTASKTSKVKGNQSSLFKKMGIDPEDNWQANYQILPDKEKIVRRLKQEAKTSDIIYLATDCDREGEAIAWHLRETIGGEPSSYRRAVFNEITKKAIQQAFANTRELDINQVNAQQVRRFLDRLVGFMLSPLLWEKIAQGLSAGRVQSVAVRLIVEREREINAFVPAEYWEIYTWLFPPEKLRVAPHDEKIKFQVTRHQGKKFRPENKEQATQAQEFLTNSSYRVSRRKDQRTQLKPSPPFITSTLQQAASTRLGFNVKRTMRLAQKLYEAGYITYMRTDSRNLSADAISAAQNLIKTHYGPRYLPEKPNFYTGSKRAQEAHEAIRPTDCEKFKPSMKMSMSVDEACLYAMIWAQFVACQMTPAEYDKTSITLVAGDYELAARGRILVFDGFTRVQSVANKRQEDRQFPDIKEGDDMSFVNIDPVRCFTRQPPRFSEAQLVGDLEKREIGRPSTYASIISTIQDRGYVSLEKGRFHAELIGDLVTSRLLTCFHNLMDYDFTANMEKLLDKIADGNKNWKTVLDDFYAGFSKQLALARDNMISAKAKPIVCDDIKCKKCGRQMQFKIVATGAFLGCSGYMLPPAERCTQTINLTRHKIGQKADNEKTEAEPQTNEQPLESKKFCPKCKQAMLLFFIDSKRRLFVCGDNSNCSENFMETGDFKDECGGENSIECDKCGTQMELKSGRFGRYYGCNNDDCKNTRKLLASGKPAPPRMEPVTMPELACKKVDDFFVLRDGAAGLFLAASKFPKHRETRPPLVSELKSHRNEIDVKYNYIMDAPELDPDGNFTQIRFSRKSGQQYITSIDENGKPTKWRMVYNNNKWQ